MAGRFFAVPPDPELLPLWKWIDQGKGILVLGGELQDELFRMRNAEETIRAWEQAGRAVILPRREVEAEADPLAAQCRSNDTHVVALARLSGARVLCSCDGDLCDDFRDLALIPNPKGKIYRNSGHRRMLRHHPGCRFQPPSAYTRRRK